MSEKESMGRTDWMRLYRRRRDVMRIEHLEQEVFRLRHKIAMLECDISEGDSVKLMDNLSQMVINQLTLRIEELEQEGADDE